MAFTVKVRGGGGLILAHFECPEHGYFEATVERDVNGDPPAATECPWHDDDVADCGVMSSWRPTAPKIKVSWGYAAVRGKDDERRPGMLDTRLLAEGRHKEWKELQKKDRQERRHHQLIAKGLKTRRVQV